MRADERVDGDLESEEVGAAVTEINSSRGEIEPKEPEHRACHTGRKQDEGPILVAYVDEQSKQHQSDAAGQTVHAVDEVQQIGDAYQPQNSQKRAPGVQFNDAAGERELESFNADAGVIHRESDKDLAGQFPFCADGFEVIPKAKPEHGQ